MRGAPITSTRLMDALRCRMKPAMRCGVNARVLPPARKRGGKMGGAQEQNAVCSVACLAWLWWISYPPTVSRPGMPRELTVETMAAKEAKNRVACSGKHLGCSKRGRLRIAVRTQWQFGPGDGNIPARTLMGNPHDGDAWQSAGKANRTSSRKIYSVCRHLFMYYPPEIRFGRF